MVRSLAEACFEALALDVLHDHEVHRILAAEFVECAECGGD